MNKTFDRYAGIAFLAVGALFFVESFRISTGPSISKVGPGTLPMALGIVMVLLSVRLIYETFKYPQQEMKQEKLDYKGFAIILGAAVLYACLIEVLGYIITTFLFLLIGFQVMQRGQWIASILIAGVFSIGVYYGYVNLLEGNLPGFPSWLGLS
ncbi:tripartite tricarboxylate transporter TctB family protein [Brevibacillus marinus]|uniref:tripartite tricarboxylate transporter TctB family protein n=1 Tax=Brevibacillus marinus TaxID=2496837 RepID=UPI000F84815A|nr:tripartite tricarboxylate transporter TctB family protein [Brevibacillus marinus]